MITDNDNSLSPNKLDKKSGSQQKIEKITILIFFAFLGGFILLNKLLEFIVPTNCSSYPSFFTRPFGCQLDTILGWLMLAILLAYYIIIPIVNLIQGKITLKQFLIPAIILIVCSVFYFSMKHRSEQYIESNYDSSEYYTTQSGY